MKHFNKTKTAYGVQDDHGVRWYLVGDGRNAVSKLLGVYDIVLPTDDPFPDSKIMDEITEVDRQMLLEARDAGVLGKVWSRLVVHLGARKDQRDEEDWEKAKKLFDKYLD